MSTKVMVHARTDKETKHEVEEILCNLGMNTSQAINMFLRQIVLKNGLPFEVKLPNPVTLKAMEDAETNTNLTKFNNSKELFDDLGI